MADASASSAGAVFSRERRKNLSVRAGPKAGLPGAQNRRKTAPETGGQHSCARPLQRDPGRGQKPPNGALKGVIYTFLTRRLPAPRPKPDAQTPA